MKDDRAVSRPPSLTGARRSRLIMGTETPVASFGVVGMAQALSGMVGMLTSALFARALAPEGYGVYTLGLGLLTIGIPLTLLGMPGTLVRFIPFYEPQHRITALLRKTMWLPLSMSGLLTLGIWVNAEGIARVWLSSPAYADIVRWSAIPLPFATLYNLLFAAFKGFRQFTAAFAGQLVYQVGVLVAGSALAWRWSRPEPVFLGLALAYGLAAIMLMRWLQARLAAAGDQHEPITEPHFYQRTLRYGFWFFLANYLLLALIYVDRWSLQRFLSPAVVGVYSAIYAFPSLLSVVTMAASEVSVTNLAPVWDAKDYKDVVTRLAFVIRGWAVAFLLVGLLLLVLFRWGLVRLVFGAAFVGGAGVLPHLLMAHYYLGLFYWVAVYPRLSERTRAIFLAAALGLGASVPLNLAFVPLWGPRGAAISASGAAFLMVVALLYVGARSTDQPLRLSPFLFGTPLLFHLPLPILAAVSVGMAVLIWFLPGFVFTREERAVLSLTLTRVSTVLTSRLRLP